MGLNILIIGNCGVGKTYTIKSIIKLLGLKDEKRVGLLNSVENENYSVAGVYDGSTFEGSDRLSMSVMTSLGGFLLENKNKTVFYEGDRFMNSNFIKKASPFIIKILGNGSKGRLERGSQQSKRHLSSILTRVNNINPYLEVPNSEICLDVLKKCLNGSTSSYEVLCKLKETSKGFKKQQTELF